MSLDNQSEPELLQPCEVCGANPFKYKCPRCEVHTCSLPCVQIHKKELECSGVRDNAAFVPMSKFNNLNLLSDYRFLEGVDRAVNNCRRDPRRYYTRYDQPLPPHLFKLKKAAHQRGTRLQYLPQHFTRHKSNSSRLDYSTRQISWKIDLIFPQGEMVKVSEDVNEKTQLSAVVNKYLDPILCPDKFKNYLKYYQASGLSDVLALLKAERTTKSNAFFLLDLSENIATNLKNRIIIENPTVLIIKKAYKDEFNILEDDDETVENDDGRKMKAGFFGDFSPISFFDDLNKKPVVQSEGEIAYDSVRAAAAELRGRALVKEESDSDGDQVEKKWQSNQRKPGIEIPTYDQLCST